MRCNGLNCVVSMIVAVLLSIEPAGCDHRPQTTTSIEFDGQSRSIVTQDVVCTKQPDGGLVIVVTDGSQRSVRVQFTQQGRLVVQKAALHYDDWTGFVADPAEVTATKADDTYTFSGRMPPNPGESQWHVFTIETTCPGYQDAPPTLTFGPRGAP
jgi:hypothetical protein